MTQIIRKKPSIDTRIERQIITGMIVSSEFLSGIQPIYRAGIFRSNFANTVAQWCFDYYTKYKKPPGVEIEDIFLTHRKGDLDPAQGEIIEEFLSSISAEYEQGDKFNVGYILDKAEDHFRLSSLETAKHELTQCIAGGRAEDGEAVIANFNRVTRVEVKGSDPFSKQSIISALDESSGDHLFHLHGALGQAIGTLERGHLFAVVGSSSVGKTWWLMYLALRALFSGYKVLFVSLEMSEDQMNRRIHHWVTGLPKKKYAGQVFIPVWDCIENQTNRCSRGCEVGIVELKEEEDDTKFEYPEFKHVSKYYKPCSLCMGEKAFRPTSWYRVEHREALSIATALAKKESVDRLAAVKAKRLRMVQYPSGELTMKMLRTYLDNLEYYEGFVPDVVVTDFADKFGTDSSEYRHGINEVWEGHKALAQSRHILVATASQSNTARTGKDIKQGDWAEDIRKLNVVDGGFAINQTDLEKMKNIQRCGVLKLRHDDFNVTRKVMVLSQLKIGRPYLLSYQM